MERVKPISPWALNRLILLALYRAQCPWSGMLRVRKDLWRR